MSQLQAESVYVLPSLTIKEQSHTNATSSGLIGLMGSYASGGGTVFGSGYDDRTRQLEQYHGAVAAAVRYRANVMGLVPTIVMARSMQERKKSEHERKIWDYRFKSFLNGRGNDPGPLNERKWLSNFKKKTLAGSYTQSEELEVLDADHWAAKLVNNPNPPSIGMSFWWMVSAHLDLCGVSYLWVVPDARGIPVQMWIIPPSWVEDKPVRSTDDHDNGELFREFVVRSPYGGQRTLAPYSPDLKYGGIVRLAYDSPITLLDSDSRVFAHRFDIDMLGMIQSARYSGLQNGGEIGTTVTTDPNAQISDDNLRKFANQFAAAYGGVYNQNRITFIPPGMSVDRPPSGREAAYSQSEQASWERVFEIFELDYNGLFKAGASSYAAPAIARKNFRYNTVKPRQDFVAGYLMEKLFQQHDPDFRVVFEDAGGYEDPQEKRSNWATGIQLPTGAPYTINEYRTEVLGLEPYDDPAADTLFFKTGLVPIDQAMDAAEDASGGVPSGGDGGEKSPWLNLFGSYEPDKGKEPKAEADVEPEISKELREKEFAESDHPRDDNGRFVSAGDIQDAKGDPEKTAELRARVTDPEQRAKLDAELGGKSGKPSKADIEKQADELEKSTSYTVAYSSPHPDIASALSEASGKFRESRSHESAVNLADAHKSHVSKLASSHSTSAVKKAEAKAHKRIDKAVEKRKSRYDKAAEIESRVNDLQEPERPDDPPEPERPSPPDHPGKPPALSDFGDDEKDYQDAVKQYETDLAAYQADPDNNPEPEKPSRESFDNAETAFDEASGKYETELAAYHAERKQYEADVESYKTERMQWRKDVAKIDRDHERATQKYESAVEKLTAKADEIRSDADSDFESEIYEAHDEFESAYGDEASKEVDRLRELADEMDDDDDVVEKIMRDAIGRFAGSGVSMLSDAASDVMDKIASYSDTAKSVALKAAAGAIGLAAKVEAKAAEFNVSPEYVDNFMQSAIVADVSRHVDVFRGITGLDHQTAFEVLGHVAAFARIKYREHVERKRSTAVG